MIFFGNNLLLFAIILCALLSGCQATQSIANPGQHSTASDIVSNQACNKMNIKIITHDNEVEIDGASLPTNMKEGYELFRVHCTKCHSQNRTVGYLQDCNFKYSENYESNLKVTILKKIRLKSGDLSKSDAKKIYDFLLDVYRMGEKAS